MIALAHLALGVGALAVVLSAALQDVHERLIDNRFSLALLGLGVAHHPVAAADLWNGLIALTAAFSLALLLLAAGFILWRLGGIGGGDVKLLVAVAFFVGPDSLALVLLGTGLAGGVLAIAYLLLPTLLPQLPLGADRSAGPLGQSSKPSLPYGVAIAFGAMAAIVPTLPMMIG